MRSLDLAISPIRGIGTVRVTSEYGNREFSYTKPDGSKGHVKDFHSGVDLGNKGDIVALAAGKVIAVRKDVAGYSDTAVSGNYVTLQHENGVATTYCHLDPNSVAVNLGDFVDAQSTLGSVKVKTTGKSTGLHLHFGVKVNGVKADPMPFLMGQTTIVGMFKPVPVVVPVAPISNPVVPTGLQIGDKVEIINLGNGSSMGTGRTAGGRGFLRYVTAIYADRPFPYQVGNRGLTNGANTTGFYQAAALKKV